MFPSFSKWETSPFHEAFGYLWLAVNGPEAKGGYWIRDGNEGSLTDLVASGNTITGKWVSRSGTSGKVTVEYKGGSGISGSWTNEARKTGGSFLGKLVPGSVKFADAQAAYENSLTNEVLLDMGCGAAGKLGAAGAAVTIWVKDWPPSIPSRAIFPAFSS
ncbi:MAG: hypothetical protein IT186_22045 [Acidobacteria bacterium]|nr:hypothetical protein [Acidobacteriota bacterium]